jgi:hypothetical protein
MRNNVAVKFGQLRRTRITLIISLKNVIYIYIPLKNIPLKHVAL